MKNRGNLEMNVEPGITNEWAADSSIDLRSSNTDNTQSEGSLICSSSRFIMPYPLSPPIPYQTIMLLSLFNGVHPMVVGILSPRSSGTVVVFSS